MWYFNASPIKLGFTVTKARVKEPHLPALMRIQTSRSPLHSISSFPEVISESTEVGLQIKQTAYG